MAADISPLLARLLAQRESWCVLREASADAPELAVLLSRPPETEFHRFSASNGGARGPQLAALVADFTRDWRGFSEAELLGAAVGASDLLPFDAEVWREALRDKAAWVTQACTHLGDLVAAHIKLQASAAKNSKPSSTPKRPATGRRAKTAG